MNGHLPSDLMEDTNDDVRLRALAGAARATPPAPAAVARGLRVVTVASAMSPTSRTRGTRPTGDRPSPARAATSAAVRADAKVMRAAARERPVIRRLAVLGSCW